MRFRTRLTVAAAAAVAAAVIAASVFAFVAVRGELRRQIDATLAARATSLQGFGVRATSEGLAILPPPALGGPGGYTQLVSSRGQVLLGLRGGDPIPVTDRVRDVAAGEEGPFFADQIVGSTRVRVITLSLAPGWALQVARPLDEMDRVLHRLRWILVVVALAGIALASGLGYLVARTALAPVDRLTRAAEHVAETGDPSTRIDAAGSDELSRLAGSFNTMLGALEGSLHAQQRLVADASHELRTPLTSLRTNIEVLARSADLPDDERERLLRDMIGQIDDLTVMVTDLVDLARLDETGQDLEDVALDELVGREVEVARAHHPATPLVLNAEHTVVRGSPERLARAVRNLLDNAAKFSPSGEPVEVSVASGEVIVRDHGPGIEPEDRPLIFDRFWRSARARALPGSGLGLSIVKQVAESHGGTVQVEEAEGGGARFRLRLAEASGSEPLQSRQG